MSDAVWAQLQRDKECAEAAEREREERLRALQEELSAIERADAAAFGMDGANEYMLQR